MGLRVVTERDLAAGGNGLASQHIAL
jgi:hypothetical protein